MNDKIQFLIDNDDNFIAKITSDKKIRIVREKKDVGKLMRICFKYGHYIDGEQIVTENAHSICKEFINYMNNEHKVLYILGTISEKMKLVRTDKYFRRRLVAGTLTGVLTLTGIGIHHSHKNEKTDYNSSGYTEDIETTTTTVPEPHTEETEPRIPPEEYFNSNRDLDSMLQKMEFHYSYEDRENDSRISTTKRYEDIFEKYAKEYGLDKKLLIALAAQESSGDHYGNLEEGYASGIMQIEKAVHIGTTLTAYNFNTQEMESIEITENNIKDLDTNIKIGCMILRNCIEQNDYNIPLSLQTYNFGPGNMQEALETCCRNESLDEEKIIADPTNNKWLDYRKFLQTGDPEYVEHVFSFLPNNTELTVLKRDNTPITITLCNDQQKVPTL